ncbi:MAG: hypothetical protein KIS66_12320 [Fimbriimonadaceae bacterium]|nr:hypothetical protein [Fimbriimonadaceae bacterium]
MAFDDLQTDEPLSHRAKPPMDMDAAMLMGCTGFVVASLATYLLAVWPYFAVIREQHTLSGLGKALALGGVPAFGLGFLLVRRYGLPAACGAVGGAMATAIFIYVRLQQVMLGFDVPEIPDPEYPRFVAWLLPLVWLTTAVFVELVAMLVWPERSPDDGD